ncbi:hypothetical protein SDJN03_02261, partial [Cucurbita argyrosperma subsp. sororia]
MEEPCYANKDEDHGMEEPCYANKDEDHGMEEPCYAEEANARTGLQSAACALFPIKVAMVMYKKMRVAMYTSAKGTKP